MPPIPAAGSGICTVTGAQGNAKAGTSCTGYYYSGIEGRCTGTACCQGTGYGGHGWCGTGYPGQHGRWGSCSPECDNAVGFDEASYESDAARAAAIPHKTNHHHTPHTTHHHHHHHPTTTPPPPP